MITGQYFHITLIFNKPGQCGQPRLGHDIRFVTLAGHEPEVAQVAHHNKLVPARIKPFQEPGEPSAPFRVSECQMLVAAEKGGHLL